MSDPHIFPKLERVVVITGASGGIGRATALALAASDTIVFLLGRDSKRLAGVLQEVRDLGTAAEVRSLDLGDDAALADFVQEMRRFTPEVHALIHCAGVVRLGRVEVMPVADLDWHYRINVRAPYLLTQQLLPMLKRARGHVIFVNSGAGLQAQAAWSHYAASKHALKALADSLRQEVRNAGVRVTSVFPGRTATPMQAAVRGMEGQPYDPLHYIRAEDIAAQIRALLDMASPSVVTDLLIRPL